MKKFSLLLFFGLFAAMSALTSCGSDDDKTPGDNQGNPTSIVGKWSAFIPVKDKDHLAFQFAHQMTYTFSSDKTFTIMTAYYHYSSVASDRQYAISPCEYDPDVPTGSVMLEGNIIRFSGTYTEANGKVTLSLSKLENYDRDKKKKFVTQTSNMSDLIYDFMYTVYDTSKKTWTWLYDEEVNPRSVTVPFKISNNTLTIGDPNKVLTFQNHHVLTSELIWQGEAPEAPANPLHGRWEGEVSYSADTNVSYAFTFNADNSLVFEYRMYGASGGLHNGYNRYGTYEVSGQTIKVSLGKFERVTGDKDTFDQPESINYTYKIENNKLYLSGDDTNGQQMNNAEFVKK